jgi:hypothetical protein
MYMNGCFEEIWSDLCSVIWLIFTVNYKITSSTGLSNKYCEKRCLITFVGSKGGTQTRMLPKSPCIVRTETWETQKWLFYYISDKVCYVLISFPFRQNFVIFVRQITWFRWTNWHWTSGVNVHNKNSNRYVPF